MGVASAPPDELVAHIADCPHCRGQLVALLAELMRPQKLVDLPCAAADDLAAFVDYERTHGLAAAARSFPSIWWSTLVNPSCDELYRDLQRLAELPAVPWARGISQKLKLTLSIVIQVNLGTIRKMLGLDQRLGTTWGAKQADVLLADTEETIGAIQIFLRRMPSQGFALVVQTNPPIMGVAILALAGTSFRAPIDAQGQALFEHLTEDLLHADATSKMTLTIEQGRGTGNRE